MNDVGEFDGKVLLVTGGTGSFGNAVARRFLSTPVAEIRVLSRDEKKQDDMRKRYQNAKLKFYVGDVRDRASVDSAMQGVDYVFHAAALKQVPSCEFHPLEAVKTNILGTENVLSSAIACNVARVICLSTDKAVYPINAMGMSKAMMEKIAVAKSRVSRGTVICATRYGNVMSSRGSVIPLFLEQLERGQPLTITDPTMTRFMMTLEDAVELVLFAFQHGRSGDIFVQKAPAATIATLAEAMIDLFGQDGHEIRIIGTRHGEKLYETLLSREERAAAEDMDGYFRIPPDMRDLNYDKFITEGEIEISRLEDYHSHNTHRLNVAGTQDLLRKLKTIQNVLEGQPAGGDE